MKLRTCGATLLCVMFLSFVALALPVDAAETEEEGQVTVWLTAWINPESNQQVKVVKKAQKYMGAKDEKGIGLIPLWDRETLPDSLRVVIILEDNFKSRDWRVSRAGELPANQFFEIRLTDVGFEVYLYILTDDKQSANVLRMMHLEQTYKEYMEDPRTLALAIFKYYEDQKKPRKELTEESKDK